jgi:hypothetical protein
VTIDELRALEDGWGGNGSPKPAANLIDAACQFVKLIARHNAYSVSIEPAYLGGVAIYADLNMRHGFRVSLMNSGAHTMQFNIPGLAVSFGICNLMLT